jgi:uncharacterized protein YdeI (YjbR/CyaY-like superfamily)
MPQSQATAELEMVSAKSSVAWGKWLAKNHRKSPGAWLRIYKKDSGIVTVTYAEALDEALCHGWIDGLRRSHDAESFVQKFTPRRAKSIWSKINRQHIERLSKEGRMKPAGMEAVAAAKNDGRWDAAYDSVKTATIPADFLKEVSRDARARAFFKSLNRTNLYSIAWRLQTANKPETRARRMEAILEMMRQGKKFHP